MKSLICIERSLQIRKIFSTHYLPLQRLIGWLAGGPWSHWQRSAHLFQRHALKLRPLFLYFILHTWHLVGSWASALPGQHRVPLAAGAPLLLPLRVFPPLTFSRFPLIGWQRSGRLGNGGQLYVVKSAVRGGTGGRGFRVDVIVARQCRRAGREQIAWVGIFFIAATVR